jgi:hypothetical protein
MKPIVFLAALSIAAPLALASPAIADTSTVSGLDLGSGRVVQSGGRNVSGMDLGSGR